MIQIAIFNALVNILLQLRSLISGPGKEEPRCYSEAAVFQRFACNGRLDAVPAAEIRLGDVVAAYGGERAEVWGFRNNGLNRK